MHMARTVNFGKRVGTGHDHVRCGVRTTAGSLLGYSGGGKTATRRIEETTGSNEMATTVVDAITSPSSYVGQNCAWPSPVPDPTSLSTFISMLPPQTSYRISLKTQNLRKHSILPPGRVPRKDRRDALHHPRQVGVRVSLTQNVEDPLHLVNRDQQSLQAWNTADRWVFVASTYAPCWVLLSKIHEHPDWTTTTW